MANVTSPIILDSTGQAIATAIANLNTGLVTTTDTDPGEGAPLSSGHLLIVVEED